MHEAVLAKFTQHADLREILLATGDARIVEHTENDAYWGDGGDGSGKNRLGTDPHAGPGRAAGGGRIGLNVQTTAEVRTDASPTPDRGGRRRGEQPLVSAPPRLPERPRRARTTSDWSSDGTLILQLHRWEVEHHHGPIGDPAKPHGNGVLLWFEIDDFDAAVARADGAEGGGRPAAPPQPAGRQRRPGPPGDLAAGPQRLYRRAGQPGWRGVDRPGQEIGSLAYRSGPETDTPRGRKGDTDVDPDSPPAAGPGTVVLVGTTVVPTVYVGLTAWRISRPGHVRDVEVEIGRSIGLQVTLDGVRYPRPGEVVYQGVVLRQDEPRRGGLVEVARAKSVRLRRGKAELTLEAEGLSLRGRRAEAGDGAGRGPALGGGAGGVSPREPRGPELQDRAGQGPHASTSATSPRRSRPTPGPPASRRAIDCSRRRQHPLRAGLTRDRKAEAVETAVAFKTMEGLPLPARVLDAFFDSADWLGRSARVQGALTLRQTGSADWQAEFQGDLLDVDLEDPLRTPIPPPPDGRAGACRGQARRAGRTAPGRGSAGRTSRAS